METRRSARKKKNPVDKPSDIEEDVQDNDDDAPEEEEMPSSMSSDNKSNGKKAARELRRKAKEDLRSRTMGLGLSISSQAEESNANKHVVFGDDESFDEAEESMEEHAGEDDVEPDDNDEVDDDDDAVEEVKSNVARDQILKQRALERETATISKLKTKSKKRKKTREERVLEDDDDDDFDEDFFAQVDSEMASSRQQNKKKRDDGELPKGRHTTFVSAHDEVSAEPVQANGNIELVVLGDDDGDNQGSSDYKERMRIVESKLGTEPSEAAKVFSRNALLNGNDEPSHSKKSKSKKASKAKKETAWKRSKKANRMAASYSRVHRRAGRATPAAHFVIQR